jgi:hypothetical protein
MVVEAKKAEVTAYKKPEVDPIDMVAPDLLDHGIEAELHAAGITGTPSEEEYAKAKEKAAKELIKDPLCYKNAQTMTEPGEKMEKAKLSEETALDRVERNASSKVQDKLGDIADTVAEKPASVGAAFRKKVLANPTHYVKMSAHELKKEFNKFKLEEGYEDEEEGSGYSYEYKEGDGASEKEIQGNIDHYKKNPLIWKMQAKKDFENMAAGESADTKTEHYPEWKKEDFEKVLKALAESPNMSEDDVNEPGIDPRRTTTTDYDSSAKQKEDGTYDISGTMNVPRLEEGDGAPEEELEKHIMEFDIYKNSLKNSGKHAYNTKLKDFKDLAAGKLGDIKDQLFPSWKKEDFAKIIKDLPGPFLLESNSQQETQLKEAVKSLIKKTLES